MYYTERKCYNPEEAEVVSVKSSVFRSVTAADRVDCPALERTIQQWWDDQGLLKIDSHRNEHSDKQFSFFDAPITASNHMGMHNYAGRPYIHRSHPITTV